MRSNKFIELAKKIAQRDKETFDSLMEFEKTGKVRTKTRLNFTIDRSIASNFKKYCQKKGYNMSAKIEQSMQKILKGN